MYLPLLASVSSDHQMHSTLYCLFAFCLCLGRRGHAARGPRLVTKSHTGTARGVVPGARDRRKFARTPPYMCDIDVRLDVDRRTFTLFHTRVFNFHTFLRRVSLICAPARRVCDTLYLATRRARCVPAQRIRTVRSYKGPQRGTVEAISVYVH